MPPDTAERRPPDRTGAPDVLSSTPMVLVSADVLQQSAELIGTQNEREHQAEQRSCRRCYRQGYHHGYAQAEQDRPIETLDVSEPAPWPTRIDAALDRLRYPPHGRARFGEPRPEDHMGGPVAPW